MIENLIKKEIRTLRLPALGSDFYCLSMGYKKDIFAVL